MEEITETAVDQTETNAGGNAFGFLPDGLQSLSQGYKEPKEFWADVSRLKALDSEAKALRGISPETLATEEEFDRAFTALGRPNDKSGYKLPDLWEGHPWTPEGPSEAKATDQIREEVNRALSDPSERAQFSDIARRCDLTQKQAEKLFSLYGGILARRAEESLAARDQADPGAVMAGLWGDQAAANLDIARRGAKSIGIGDELDREGLSAHPLVLKLAHALGAKTAEDQAEGLGGAGPGAGPVGEAAREELRRVVGSEAYKNHDPQAIKKAEILSARVHLK